MGLGSVEGSSHHGERLGETAELEGSMRIR